jgi:hypothetical protein
LAGRIQRVNGGFETCGKQGVNPRKHRTKTAFAEGFEAKRGRTNAFPLSAYGVFNKLIIKTLFLSGFFLDTPLPRT